MITLIKDKLDERKYNKEYTEVQIRTMKAKLLEKINKISNESRITNSKLIQIAHNTIIHDKDHVHKKGNFKFQEYIYTIQDSLPSFENKNTMLDPEFIRINDLINQKRISSDIYLDILNELNDIIKEMDSIGTIEINKVSAEMIYDRYTTIIQDVYTQLTPILNKLYNK